MTKSLSRVTKNVNRVDRHLYSLANKRPAILLISIFLVFIPFVAFGGTYTSTAHGNSSTGVDRSVVTGSSYPDSTPYAKGHCGHCHEKHASVGGAEPTPPAAEGATDFALFRSDFGSNKNELCFACHENFTFASQPAGYGRHGVYEGRTNYEASIHNTSSSMVWPDGSPPGPTVSDYGNCLNCHNPHGYADSNGLIPSMLFSREENLCLACHDGSPVTEDVKTIITTKTYRHAVDNYTGIHLPGLSSGEEDRTYLSNNKHVECVDCHNPHAVDSANPTAHAPGVTPTNGGFWSAPTGFTETKVNGGVNDEYKICFRCHSSYNTSLTTWNASWTDVSLEFNVNNYSYHYVEGDKTTASALPSNGSGCSSYGPNAGSTQIPRASTTTGNFNSTYIGVMEPSLAGLSDSQIRSARLKCSSCHGSDGAGGSTPEGPHGSAYQFILKVPSGSPYTRWDSTVRYSDGNVWCLNCHDPNFTNTGFVQGSQNLHTRRHNRRACQYCHVAIPHGWKRYRLLRLDDCDSSPYVGITGGLRSGINWKTSGNWQESDCHNAAVGSCG